MNHCFSKVKKLQFKWFIIETFNSWPFASNGNKDQGTSNIKTEEEYKNKKEADNNEVTNMS